MTDAAAVTGRILTPESFLQHWQGHRRLTRRVIEAFPDDQLFTFSLAGMRTFGQLALELLAMGAPMVRGVATGEWSSYAVPELQTKAEVLREWDAATSEIDGSWAQIPPERFTERLTAFGMYEGPAYELLLYVIDNEIHHRGQGYVYLRALGIAPPPFWERR